MFETPIQKKEKFWTVHDQKMKDHDAEYNPMHWGVAGWSCYNGKYHRFVLMKKEKDSDCVINFQWEKCSVCGTIISCATWVGVFNE